jgi:transcriptional regulator with XRE-family HTH domain
MKLAELRKAAHLSQGALAQAVGRAQPFIGKLECGMTDINNITLESAYKLSKVLGCTIEDLVDKEKVQ